MEEETNYPINIPMPIQQSDTAIKLQLDMGGFLKKIYLRFMGVYEDEDGNLKQLENTEPLMNEIGASHIQLIFDLMFDRPVFLGNLDQKDVREITYSCTSNLATLIASRYKEFNIKKSHFNLITDIPDSAIYCNLTRAIDSGVIKAITTISRVTDVQQLIQKPIEVKQERKLFGFLRRK